MARAGPIEPGVTGARNRQIDFALARQAHRRDGARRRRPRPRRPDRRRRADRVPQPRRSARAGADPPRRRACARRGRAVAVAGHAGDDRAGDRERLLLRLLPQRAVHARGLSRRSRRRCARSSRATRRSPSASSAATRPRAISRQKGEAFKIELVDAIPADQDVKLYSPGRVDRPLPRPAHDLDRQGRRRVQADEGRRRLLARRFQPSRCCRASTRPPSPTRKSSTPICKQLEEAEKRDHRKLGREMDLFHFQEEGPGTVFWHPKGWTLFQTLIAYMRRRLAADYQEVSAPQVLDKSPVGDLGPLGLVSREHVHGAPRRRRRRGRGRAHLRRQADELPGPCPDLQERPALLSRAAAAARRIRRGASLRALGRAAWRDARARLHAGRRAYLLHRGSARRRVPQDQRADPLGLSGFRLRQDRREALDPAGKARRRGRAVGSRRER